MDKDLKPGKRGFQAGTLSNAKNIGDTGERFVPNLDRSGRMYKNRRDW